MSTPIEINANVGQRVVVVTDGCGVFYGTLSEHVGEAVTLISAQYIPWTDFKHMEPIDIATAGLPPGAPIYRERCPKSFLLGVREVHVCTPDAVANLEESLRG